MKQVILPFVLALLFGAAAAFFRPAVPYQVEMKPEVLFPTTGGALFTKKSDSFDTGLDNMDIEEDRSISPARKCGFCIGWAGQTNCPVSGL